MNMGLNSGKFCRSSDKNGLTDIVEIESGQAAPPIQFKSQPTPCACDGLHTQLPQVFKFSRDSGGWRLGVAMTVHPFEHAQCDLVMVFKNQNPQIVRAK